MQEHSSLDEYVAACLRGTRLAPDRRREAAEELRSHLADRIAAKRRTGLDEDQSIRAAISEFGLPQRIRKGFHRQQVLLDIHAGLVETRKNLWQPLLYGGIAGLLAFGIHFRTGRIGAAVVTACTMFFILSVVTAGFMFVCSTLSYRLRRPLLRSEYRFLPSLARWSFAVAAAIAVIALLAMLTSAAFVNLVPPAQFCRLYLSGWLESFAGTPLRSILGAIGFGLAMAIYEHRLCLKAEDACEV
jgi:hypothetical protein